MRFENLPVIVPDYLHVMCIGNILMGGTGKSPLVRAFSSNYLENDVSKSTSLFKGSNSF